MVRPTVGSDMGLQPQAALLLVALKYFPLCTRAEPTMTDASPDRVRRPKVPEILQLPHDVPTKAGEPSFTQDLLAIVEAARIGSGAYVALICSRAPDGSIEILASSGAEAQQVDHWQRIAPETNVPLAECALRGAPVFVGSRDALIARYPVLTDNNSQTQALACVPVIDDGLVVGALGVAFAQSRDIDHAHLLLLEALASQAVPVLIAARTEVAVPLANSGPVPMHSPPMDELIATLSGAYSPEAIASAVASKAAPAAGAAYSNVAMLDPSGTTAQLDHGPQLENDMARRWATIPVDHSTPLGKAMLSGRTVLLGSVAQVGQEYPHLVADTLAAGLASTASVPMLSADGQVVGAVGFGWTRSQIFDSALRDRMALVAGLAGDMLERSRLLAAERAARRDADLVRHALAELLTTMTFEDVCQAVFGAVMDAFGAVGCSLLLVDEGRPDTLLRLDSVNYTGGVAPRRFETAFSAGTLPADAARHDAPIYLAALPEALMRYPMGLAHDQIVGTGHEAFAALPLHEAGRLLGVISMSFAEPKDFDDAQRAAMAGLADHVADAIARALAHDRDHQLVLQLQASLMSGALPDGSAVALAASYLPSQKQPNVGGDWYDAVVLEGSDVMLIVGDAVGHGIRAAVAMGQVRSAVRVLAHLLGPAELLEALDRFVLQVPDALFASVAVVKLDTLARRATYSLAGHLPPLASSPDGEVIELAGALGPPLGVDKRPRRQDTFLLPDAATVILYTDGLVERRGEALDVGIARLAALLSRSRELNVDAVCAQLVRGSIEGTAQRDDIALLCARLPG